MPAAVRRVARNFMLVFDIVESNEQFENYCIERMPKEDLELDLWSLEASRWSEETWPLSSPLSFDFGISCQKSLYVQLFVVMDKLC